MLRGYFRGAMKSGPKSVVGWIPRCQPNGPQRPPGPLPRGRREGRAPMPQPQVELAWSAMLYLLGTAGQSRSEREPELSQGEDAEGCKVLVIFSRGDLVQDLQ